MSVPRIFDRQAYAARRARARASFLAEEVGEALAWRLTGVNRRFVHGLELGARSEVSPALAPLAERWTRTALIPSEATHVVIDEETLPFVQSFDLIVSPLSLHAVNDLPGTLAQIRQALKPDGLFLAALFGSATLFELRTALAEAESEILGGVSPHVFPFADVRELGGLLQRAGFALPVADCETTVAHYAEFKTLVEDLRALGETNVLVERSRNPLRRDVVASAIASYSQRHADAEGRLPATFEIVYLTAWSPHESQQKPLRPGSATRSLADALGTREHSAGDIADPKKENR